MLKGNSNGKITFNRTFDFGSSLSQTKLTDLEKKPPEINQNPVCINLIAPVAAK